MSLLASVFNHLVLPPQLPGQQDEDLDGVGLDILARLTKAALTLGKLAGPDQAPAWDAVQQSLQRCHALHCLGRLDKQVLFSAFQQFDRGQPLILHVTEQNAALIIRQDSRNVVFEAFGASPPSAVPLASQGALLWDLPDCAAQIPESEFHKPSFQNALAEFLEKGSMEPLKFFQPQAKKAQVSVIESRDTASPGLITSVLLPLLEGMGSRADGNVPRIRKRVRDDATIATARLPWRRLPFWLTLRVSTQRQLQLALGSEDGRASYKFLIAVLLVDLLNDCPSQLSPELTMTLQAKICRRLAKLEQQKDTSRPLYDHLFEVVGPYCEKPIVRITKLVQSAWDKFKRETTRPVPCLPKQADQKALHLTLPHSGAYLVDILKLPRVQQKSTQSLRLPSRDGIISQAERFTDVYFTLARLEADIEAQRVPLGILASDQSACKKLAEFICDLFAVVGTSYDACPEQMSVFILSLFTLWTRLDQCMAAVCPMLLDYQPVFKSELLDALHLPTTLQMQRLHDIQAYLRGRFSKARYDKTILSEPDKHSFPVRYATGSRPMQELLGRIRQASAEARHAKSVELDTWWRDYDEHSTSMSSGTCVCTFNRDGTRNVKGCTKCWHRRARNRMEIYAHEDFLPSAPAKAALVVFELGIPDFVASYRDATWKIVALAHPTAPSSTTPSKLLDEYDPLFKYTRGASTRLTLASTSKSFCGTHYKVAKERMRASQSDVLFPNGLNFLYYDTASETWLKDFDKPLTFQHLCGVHLPPALRDSVVPNVSHPPADAPGPTSYEIVASETKTPANMPVHEFTAYQRLLAGKTRRWYTMLVELGASNLNFSNESTIHLFNGLATQAGPAVYEKGLFRDAHVVFKDASFCSRLVQQIGNRLRNIAPNWREVRCMELLITLSLRLYNLSSSSYSTQAATKLVKEARDITLQWITRLRSDVRNAVDASTAKSAAEYAFLAALLCRRTFSTFANTDRLIGRDDLSVFVQASLALQQNLLVDLEQLPPLPKLMLIRDTKMAYEIQSVLLRSIFDAPDSIGTAINASWSDTKIFAAWQNLSASDDRWLVSTMAETAGQCCQVVHYNYIAGHLLVDGKPLGRLPREIRDSNEVKRFFGTRHLLTYRSADPGMSYVMAGSIQGNKVHFGIRGGHVVIRTRTKNRVLEYIPPEIFLGTNTSDADFPHSLISDCAHWLNLETRCLEIRRSPSHWTTRSADWIVDIIARRANRNNRSSLVDPKSVLCKQVTDMFRFFETPDKITVFQPKSATSRLSLELRHLQLSFWVNSKGLLQCKELNAEIDPNQDAGTLYGLRSMIILRDVDNNKRRSIIVPCGAVSTKRRGMHVSVEAASTAQYARFEIDSVLGRLTCPVEPVLVYTKARLHAYTSFVMPDPLTGRTGTEEALRILQSGYCQPWMPLAVTPREILDDIGKLSPRREYYPKDKKTLQTVTWNPDLTVVIQHDAFDIVVQSILHKSEQLEQFYGCCENNDATPVGHFPSHLRSRGISQRRLYECSMLTDANEQTFVDTFYNSGDWKADSKQAAKVYHLTMTMTKRPFIMPPARHLSLILENSLLLGGFDTTAEIMPVSLADVVERQADEQFGSLVNTFAHSDPQDSYRLIFRLGLMSLNPKNDIDLLKVFAAFACLTELKDLQAPPYPSFTGFQLNDPATADSLFRVISVDLPEQGRGKYDRAQEAHRRACIEEGRRLTRFVVDQWPNEAVTLAGFQPDSDRIDAELAMERIAVEWKRLLKNSELSSYVMRVQNILIRCKGAQYTSMPAVWSLSQWPFHLPDRTQVVISTAELLGNHVTTPLTVPGLQELIPIGSPTSTLGIQPISPSQTASELAEILRVFTSSTDPLRQAYGKDLEESLTALQGSCSPLQAAATGTALNVMTISRNILEVRILVTEHLARLRNAFSAGEDRFKWLELCNLWPCKTSIDLLERLRSSDPGLQLNPIAKEAVVSHGMLITTLQRLLRIQDFLCQGQTARYQEELMNPGHMNWDPAAFPDWLLLEIDGNILIRPEQVDVAHAIIAPTSGQNSVLQLNMGKGKTSCIVPMAMAILSDGKQLARLVVPKPLILPTAQMIQSRLGGLIGRETRHVPFSRRTKPTKSRLQLYADLHDDMLNVHGIVLSALEHVLSYRLSGLQHLTTADLDTAHEMIGFQSWLSDTCRDVLDESDVSLAVKTQLIYPNGEQIMVDGHPHRWEVAQALLGLVKDHLPGLKRKFPKSIEIIDRPNGFPMIYFLQSDVEEELHRRIIDDVCSGKTSFLRFTDAVDSSSGLSKRHAAHVRKVLSDHDLNTKLSKRVAKAFADSSTASKILLLVRGLLHNRIILLCLKKRWNVQYGLHPNRDPVAVPFEAKGVPSEQAEFGHPDAAIFFTCLGFYYFGLNPQQFSQGLRRVLSSHDPSSTYDRWTGSCHTLPEALQHWNVINVDDQGQMQLLWKYLRFSRSVLDHYMNHFVFPLHAKQFAFKLQASGWDLPLLSSAEDTNRRCAKTTGFSGTNDNKALLPLTIQQHDLPTLRQTNAEVLICLLQERNRGYHVAAREGKRLSERGFLKELAQKKIRVLIDAGAYILEMSNAELAKTWLDIDTDPQAAVYFGFDNRAWVRYRGTKTAVPLLATPLANNLDGCLVYLDEAHTRGVDLKLPLHSRGALTLALGQSKDHTVQAAMRLRQLGTSQSVCFFAAPEAHRSILDVCGLKETAKVDSSHVVHWLLEQTCRANEQLQSLYISQGTDFCIRTNAQWMYPRFLTRRDDRDALVEVLQVPEQQTLEQLYGNAGTKSAYLPSAEAMTPVVRTFSKQLSSMRQAVTDNAQAVCSSALEIVEQEREVEFQVEEVREVQRPTHYKPLKFPGLHPVITAFVNTGILDGDEGYLNVFTAISRTAVGQKFEIEGSESRVFVSVEFVRTIKKGPTDSFLRPVEWVLYSPTTTTALVIIAEEAELLIPTLRAQNRPAKVHLLMYSAPVTKKMSCFSDLTYHTLPKLPKAHVMPSWLTIEVGILAGRLYANFEECSRTMQYVAGYANGDRNGGLGRKASGFLLEWLSLRRKGQDVLHTPMGYICHGRPLHAEHAFFVASGGQDEVVLQSGHVEDDGDAVGDESIEEEDDEWLGEEDVEAMD
ncbi:hypothetical protein K491DRAFT_722967 [Lophiostoma macrostomum CBS 122681]|uniref:ubiquitinyl hydrolase 1 n=1 Tax=Lophiostoma macrostomum CBS 122681 TaxID=1314788 RepID=A0A6A6SJG8_9PLEO|nr:hypothetical protein K491DRAFT_722967 [Lophiostoma macrostomum CBS 122681]